MTHEVELSGRLQGGGETPSVQFGTSCQENLLFVPPEAAVYWLRVVCEMKAA